MRKFSMIRDKLRCSVTSPAEGEMRWWWCGVPKGLTYIRCSHQSVLLQSIREQIQHETWLHVFVRTFKGLQTFTLLNRQLLSCLSLCAAGNTISWINVTRYSWVFCFSLYLALATIKTTCFGLKHLFWGPRSRMQTVWPLWVLKCLQMSLQTSADVRQARWL